MSKEVGFKLHKIQEERLPRAAYNSLVPRASHVEASTSHLVVGAVAVEGAGAAASATLGVDGVPDGRVVPSVEAPESLVAATALARRGPPDRLLQLHGVRRRCGRYDGQVSASRRRAPGARGVRQAPRPPRARRTSSGRLQLLPNASTPSGARTRLACAAVRGRASGPPASNDRPSRSKRIAAVVAPA